jgi:hypothetical protein
MIKKEMKEAVYHASVTTRADQYHCYQQGYRDGYVARIIVERRSRFEDPYVPVVPTSLTTILEVAPSTDGETDDCTLDHETQFEMESI